MVAECRKGDESENYRDGADSATVYPDESRSEVTDSPKSTITDTSKISVDFGKSPDGMDPSTVTPAGLPSGLGDSPKSILSGIQKISMSSDDSFVATYGYDKEEGWSIQGKEKGEKEKKGAEESPARPSRKRRARPGKLQREEEGAKKHKTVTWAEVTKSLIATITSTDPDTTLSAEDLVNIQDQILELALELPDEKAHLCTVARAGISEGMIIIGFNFKEGVEWFKEVVRTLSPLEEGGPRYCFYEPGTHPFNYFKVIVSHRKAATVEGRFVELIKKFNPALRSGNLKVANVLANTIGKDKTPIVVLSIKADAATTRAIEELKHKVSYGLGTVTFEPKNKAVLEETPEQTEGADVQMKDD